MEYFRILLISALIYACNGSIGDRAGYYQDCVKTCEAQICGTGNPNPFINPLIGLELILWSCRENCQYDCQFRTVDYFNQTGRAIPQFHGKWPFIRFFGFQEPASTIFSLINLFLVLYYRSKFKRLVISENVYAKLWGAYFLVCLNCWIWSSIYHARDSDLGERLDYASAFAMVTASFYVMSFRTLRLNFNFKSIMWSIFCAFILVNHTAYIMFTRFNYVYNMTANIIVGALTVVGWLFWVIFQKVRHPSRWKLVIYVVLVSLSTCLEVFDFPPLWWILDAHSLWHLSTCFIAPIFYSFIIDDCLYLSGISERKLPFGKVE